MISVGVKKIQPKMSDFITFLEILIISISTEAKVLSVKVYF